MYYEADSKEAGTILANWWRAHARHDVTEHEGTCGIVLECHDCGPLATTSILLKEHAYEVAMASYKSGSNVYTY